MPLGYHCSNVTLTLLGPWQVLDLGQVVAGNFAGAILSYFGADVIKVCILSCCTQLVEHVQIHQGIVILMAEAMLMVNHISSSRA
jgi:hypothetical protein